MIHIQTTKHSSEWLKYLAIAMICTLVALDGISSAVAETGRSGGQQIEKDENDAQNMQHLVIRSDTVAARLGGYHGILSFLHNFAVPALLADGEIAPFFENLTITPDDIEMCLAMMLDHDLGGSSRKSGATVESGHKCRSSMSKIHRGRNITDEAFTKFIQIVGEQAAIVGVHPLDIKAIAKVLERNRGGTRNK